MNSFRSNWVQNWGLEMCLAFIKECHSIQRWNTNEKTKTAPAHVDSNLMEYPIRSGKINGVIHEEIVSNSGFANLLFRLEITK